MEDIEESKNANESRKLYKLVNSDGRALNQGSQCVKMLRVIL
jgi:hypothetical protein